MAHAPTHSHIHDDATFELRCPKDQSPMVKVQLHGITIDRCPGCGAIWFDMNELERLLKDDRSELKQADIGATIRIDTRIRTKDLDCPRDKERMKEVLFPEQSHIHVMKCTTCRGMLLDAGEAKDAVSFTMLERVKSFFS
jgi:Zn-finger nucleic acid-binding protein